MLSKRHTWLIVSWVEQVRREHYLQHYFKKLNNKGLDRGPLHNFEYIFLHNNKSNQDNTILQDHLHSLKDKRILSDQGNKGIDALELP